MKSTANKLKIANSKTDSAGYTIASGDERIESVLANSINGQLGQEISNLGFALFLVNINYKSPLIFIQNENSINFISIYGYAIFFQCKRPPIFSIDNFPKTYYVKNGKLNLIRQYEPQNSASADVLNQIIKEMIDLYPADKYGLILWSHGTGWLPEDVYDKYAQAKVIGKYQIQGSFGKDNGKGNNNKEMDIIDLGNVLSINFDYIVFDACLMSNIEVLYQLRNKAKIIIASLTETLGTGFPYDEILPLLFVETVDYKPVA